MNDEKPQKSEKSQTALERTIQVLGVVVRVIGTLIKWSFIAALFTVGLTCWLIDIVFNNGRSSIDPPWMPKQPPPFDPDKFREAVGESTAEEILKKFGRQFEELEIRNRLEPEEKKVVRKLKGLDRDKLRFQLQHALRDDEIEILFILLLKLLGFIKVR
ncbi:MAG: hypothetical protein MUC60_00415 [Oscillatoria sp. Prado101]|jgi:hypothetical protein|nr:hypothetical protein [Oscillatoria sp. Prado101]